MYYFLWSPFGEFTQILLFYKLHWIVLLHKCHHPQVHKSRQISSPQQLLNLISVVETETERSGMQSISHCEETLTPVGEA